MVQVKAIFDGEKIVLPSDFKPRGIGEVMVTFPDEMLTTSSRSGRSLEDILRDAKPSGRTMEDVDRQMQELRDEWDDDPRDRLRGKP